MLRENAISLAIVVMSVSFVVTGVTHFLRAVLMYKNLWKIKKNDTKLYSELTKVYGKSTFIDVGYTRINEIFLLLRLEKLFICDKGRTLASPLEFRFYSLITFASKITFFVFLLSFGGLIYLSINH